MADFPVSAPQAGDQKQPAVASLLGTQYMALWADQHDFTVKGRLLGLQGNTLDDEFTVGSRPAGGAPVRPQWPAVLSAGISGQFAVWLETSPGIPGPHPSLRLQRFTDGRPAGEPVLVSEDVDPEVRPFLTFMTDGGALVTWADPRADQRIRARRFTSKGAPATGELTLSTTEGFHRAPAATVLKGGNWVCAWSTDPLAIGGDRLTLRFFDSEANALTAEIQPNVGHVTGVNGITLLDSGQFVVTSVSHIQPSDLGKDQSTVVANVFKPDGTKTVHFTAGDPRHFTRYDPAVAHLPSGRFLLAWVEESADTHQTVPTAMARLYSEHESSLGEKVQVSTATTGARFQTCVTTAFGNGPEGALIAWADDSRPDGDPSVGVQGRTFTITAGGTLVQLFCPRRSRTPVTDV
ncbi:hypothetical protein [Streptomyces thermodiastaticus]|uniref:hypothetical protein n=1 Tax=Streptomyces thermodiastaticus TaxID=44061 RepID=UPI001674B27E|nr:hypothetical protein [Streptomyces thermodiastaticus]MCE7552752.1 hypothetical protein [Streptomyces thermodiastaticus]GHF89183.1 hypothetical protein GCM10018787_42340 [Streptomyces thermodiastaticus]